jgi:hypothetical protein
MALALSFCKAVAASPNTNLPPLVPGTLDWDYVGNSFSDFTVDAENGLGRWVQNFVDEIEVTPDGTVIVACDWDEGGRCLGLYKDGRPSGMALGKNNRRGGHRNGGWGTSSSAITVAGDEILCASNDGEFYRFRWTPGDIESPRFRDSFTNGFGDAVNDKASIKVIGMNARGRLVAVVLANGFVEIRDRVTWAVRHRFAAPGVHDAAWSADDRLWLASAVSVWEVDATGKPTGHSLPDPGVPSAVAFSPQGELVVCDDGPRQQLRFYLLGEATPWLGSTFGQVGGIRAGTPGVPASDKLMRPAGANRDAAGNLYVAMRYDELPPTGGCLLRSFDPTGKLRWELVCHVFSECMDVVPAKDGSLTAYGYRSIFTKAKGAPRGVWTLDAITLDSRNQLADPRYKQALLQATAAWRMVDRVSYLFTWGSGGNSPLEITRLAADGRLATHHQTIGAPGPWAWDVDETGAVWSEDGNAMLRRRQPVGSTQWGKPERFPLPPPLTEVHRLAYDAPHDVMYASGYSTNTPKPSSEWGLIGRVLARIDRFTTAPTVAWTSGVRVDDENLPPKAMCQAGDYIFTAACKPTGGLRGQIYVYRTSDGSFVGRISAPKAIAQNTGWIDLSHGLRARESGGTYYITQEDNLRAKVILHIWKP